MMKKFLAIFFAGLLLLAQVAQAQFIVNELNGFGVGGSAPPISTYIGTTVDATNVTNYTFTSAAIGTASADRYVLIGVAGRGSLGSARTISSATIGGNTATLQANSSFGDLYVGWIGLTVTTGTTATVVVNFSGAMNNAIIHVYTITGLASTTPTDTAFASGVDPTTSTIDSLADGIIFAHAGVDGSTSGTTWTGISEDYDAIADSQLNSAAHSQFAAAQTNLTVKADFVSATSGSISVISMR